MGSYYKEHRILPHFQNSACCISIQYNFAMRLGGLRDKDGFMLSTFNSISFLFETISSPHTTFNPSHFSFFYCALYQPLQELEKMTNIILQALKITGQRGIINKGWGW
ncbi:putative sterol 3-beta-glucosyltransferase [Rosa chinensis]|uniref:Putative sterol 3-beta-glucosyltransferase n=1 Tax=Rosa chinensis TaxID=74649 RepID=A0A2P6QPQ3_ROSCH|nr:putative sterol 3-beta-glucosyltransferase [Rosa chinensis]